MIWLVVAGWSVMESGTQNKCAESIKSTNYCSSETSPHPPVLRHHRRKQQTGQMHLYYLNLSILVIKQAWNDHVNRQQGKSSSRSQVFYSIRNNDIRKETAQSQLEYVVKSVSLQAVCEPNWSIYSMCWGGFINPVWSTESGFLFQLNLHRIIITNFCVTLQVGSALGSQRASWMNVWAAL